MIAEYPWLFDNPKLVRDLVFLGFNSSKKTKVVTLVTKNNDLLRNVQLIEKINLILEFNEKKLHFEFFGLKQAGLGFKN